VASLTILKKELRSLRFGIAWIIFSEEKEIMQEIAQTASTVEVINQFNDAFNRHDIQAMMALMTDDCIFDNTYPAPDGEQFAGQEAVRGFWEEFFRSSSDAVIQSEEMFAHADRCVFRWRYSWIGTESRACTWRGCPARAKRQDSRDARLRQGVERQERWLPDSLLIEPL
jgi:hypothetical protein